MKNRMAKVLTVSTLCAALLLAISGCGKSSTTTPSASPAAASTKPAAETAAPEAATPEPKKETVKLTFATFNTWWNYDFLKKAIKMYEDETGNKIDPQIYPDDQFTNIIKAKLATSDVPDVFAFNSSVKDFGPDQLAPLDGPWVSLIDKSFATKHGYSRVGDDSIYAAPFGNAGFQGIMYNKEVLQKAGVSLPLKTYADFLAACEAIKKIGVTPVYLPNKDGWTAQILVYTGSQYIPIKDPSYAENIYTNKLKPQDAPMTVDLLKRVAALKTKGYMNADMASATMAMAEQALAEGKAAFVGGGNWLYSDFTKNYPDKAANISMTAVNWGDDPNDLSVMKSGSGNGLFIPAASKQKAAAADFINFIMSEKTMLAMYEIQPGVNVLGYKTKASEWDLEMQALIDNGTAKARDNFVEAPNNFKVGTPFNGGNVGGMAQALFGGKDPVKLLTEMYNDSVKANKAAGIPGF